MKKHLVDPFTVFDERGRSLKSYEQLEAENARLEKENQHLRRLLKFMVDKYQPTETKPETATRH
jgi:hypothetical protein